MISVCLWESQPPRVMGWPQCSLGRAQSNTQLERRRSAQGALWSGRASRCSLSVATLLSASLPFVSQVSEARRREQDRAEAEARHLAGEAALKLAAAEARAKHELQVGHLMRGWKSALYLSLLPSLASESVQWRQTVLGHSLLGQG